MKIGTMFEDKSTKYDGYIKIGEQMNALNALNKLLSGKEEIELSVNEICRTINPDYDKMTPELKSSFYNQVYRQIGRYYENGMIEITPRKKGKKYVDFVSVAKEFREEI